MCWLVTSSFYVIANVIHYFVARCNTNRRAVLCKHCGGGRYSDGCHGDLVITGGGCYGNGSHGDLVVIGDGRHSDGVHGDVVSRCNVSCPWQSHGGIVTVHPSSRTLPCSHVQSSVLVSIAVCQSFY